MTPTIFISAGEASGEAYGALLISELQKQLAAQHRQAHFTGMGGPRMVAAGLERIVRAEDMAVMGITEVVRHLPRIYREFRKLKRALREHRPAVAVFIDFPDIHFKLAAECHRLGIPVVYFVSPQLWAWKKHRIKLVQKYVDRMLVIFPFEEPFYREHGVQAEFVGHPLAELPLPTISREDFARENGLDPQKTWIALLPGSRMKEIRDNLPEMLKAGEMLVSAHSWGSKSVRAQSGATDPLVGPNGRNYPTATPNPVGPGGATQGSGNEFPEALFRLAPAGLQFLVPLAPTLTQQQRNWVLQFIQRLAPDLPVQVLGAEGAVGPTVGGARASIVSSGTATVEAALIGNPFVVVYRVSPLTYAIAKRVVDVPHVAMANLIANKRIVPELIQNEFTASNIVRQLQPLLPDGPPRQSMMKELAVLRSTLHARELLASREPRGAIERVAEITLDLLGTASPADPAAKLQS